MAVETGTSAALSRRDNHGKKGRVLVLGLGNILLKDDGIGVHIAAELEKLELPANVEVIDGGTAGLDILLSQEDLDKLVVVDAIRFGKKPGTIYMARAEAGDNDKLSSIFNPDKESKISLHQVGLIDALAAAEKLDRAPGEIVIIGVEPKQINHGLELTEQVGHKIPEIVNTVLEEIRDAVHTR